MLSFHRDRRGTASIETAAVIPIIAILFALIADSFWVFHPAIAKEVEIRALAWGKLHDAYSEVKNDVDGDASDSSSTSGVGSVLGEAVGLGATVSGWVDSLGSVVEPAVKWDIERVKLEATWGRTFEDEGEIEATFEAAMVTDPHVGPDSIPCFPELIWPWIDGAADNVPGCG